jgi:hypothetical protein
MTQYDQGVRGGVSSGDQIPKPWWRERWPWILMAGPAIVIVACIITIILAANNFGDQDIRDGGVKRGLVVSKQPAPDVPATVGQAPGK